MNSSGDIFHRDSERGRHSEPRFKKLSYSAGHSRRFGAYFSSRSSILESRRSQDSDETSWELVTLRDDLRPEMTDAQKVAMLYRMRSTYSDSSCSSTMGYPPPRYSDTELPVNHRSPSIFHDGSPEKQYTPIVGSRELGITLDAARQRSLLAVFQEAMDTANMYNQRPGDKNPVICPRFECGDLLPNAGALIYHLHIHDIEANLVICKTCKNTYEHGFDTHVCPKKPHRRVQWHSPLKLPSYSIQNCAQIKHIISSFIFAS